MIYRTAVATMPGKMGDLLFSMLIVREIAKDTGRPVTMVTSAYCAPVAPLLRRLPYVGAVVVLGQDEYRIEHTHFGAQPWRMDVPGLTDVDERIDVDLTNPPPPTFHLGFRHFPFPGQTVPELCGEPYGIKPSPGPWLPEVRIDRAGPVAVHLGEVPERLEWFVCLAQQLGRPLRVIHAGPRTAGFGRFGRLLSRAGSLVVVNGFDEIHGALEGCSEFWGVNSGPSIVAMGAGLQVTWPHDGANERERWAHHGCEVWSADRNGTMRRLRPAGLPHRWVNKSEQRCKNCGQGDDICVACGTIVGTCGVCGPPRPGDDCKGQRDPHA